MYAVISNLMTSYVFIEFCLVHDARGIDEKRTEESHTVLKSLLNVDTDLRLFESTYSTLKNEQTTDKRQLLLLFSNPF